MLTALANKYSIQMYTLLIKKKKKKILTHVPSLQISVAIIAVLRCFLRELGQCMSYYFNETGRTVM